MIKPKITVITVVYNAHAIIERTIKSVIGQSYLNIEYIIIDGASSDGTLEIAERYESKIALIESGRDDGIYDAMNKGLKYATGDYVLFLNAGDELYDADTLTKVFAGADYADVYYGNTAIISSDGAVLGDRRLTPPDALSWKSLKYGMCVSHQSFIARRSLCENYNLHYKVSADIDWVIKVLKSSDKIKNTYIYIAKYLEGGKSAQHRRKALMERFEIMTKHYGFFSTALNHIYIGVRWPIHKLSRKSMS